MGRPVCDGWGCTADPAHELVLTIDIGDRDCLRVRAFLCAPCHARYSPKEIAA